MTRALLEGDYRVALAGRRADALRETLADLPAGPDRALVVPADVTEPAAVLGLFQRVAEAWGRTSTCCSTTPAFRRARRRSRSWRWSSGEAVVDANLTGSFLCAQEALRLMKAQSPQGGRIINNGSISAHAPRPNAAAYTATKHAITGLTKTISLEGRAFDIACGQIDIGNAVTDLAPPSAAAPCRPTAR